MTAILALCRAAGLADSALPGHQNHHSTSLWCLKPMGISNSPGHRAEFIGAEIRKTKGPVMNIPLKSQTSTGSRPLGGKVSLVTGSTSGIGLGIAQALAAAGSDVVLNGFGPADQIEKERAGIASKYGIKAGYNGADMSKPEQIAAMVAET